MIGFLYGLGLAVIGILLTAAGHGTFIVNRIGSCKFPRDHFFNSRASDILGTRLGSLNIQDQDSTEIIHPLHSCRALRVHSIRSIFSRVRGRKVFR